MHTLVKWLTVPILAVTLVPFLAEWPSPADGSGSGIAYAKGGGGGNGGGGSDGGGGKGGSGHGGGQGAGAADSPGRGAGEGGGRGHGGADHGGKGHDTAGSAGVGHGHQGRGLGGAVSEAAKAAAHMSQQDLQEAGFRNRGEAVSTAVHEAQQAARDTEETAPAAAEPEGPAGGTPSPAQP